VVGDDAALLGRVLTEAIGSVDLVVCTGGLGPTEDDVTREAIARALNMPLEIDPRVEERIRARFAARGLPMVDKNRRQAMVPRGAAVLENPNGTAPGVYVEHGGTTIVLLPGPPREMAPMLDSVIRERLAPRTGGTTLFRRVVKATGRTEADVDTRAAPIYVRWQSQIVPIHTTILAASGQIELHLTAESSNATDANVALDLAVAELQQALGADIFSTDGRSIEAVVGGLLRAAEWTLAVAESCTGGLLTSRLTDVPGSSLFLDRAAICYSNASKVDWLGVPESLLAEHGAVSEPVARAMAEGARAWNTSTVGIGVTGIAGPSGGTPEKPVGTVAIAVVSSDATRVLTSRFMGDRVSIKNQAALKALDILRRLLLEAGHGPPPP
jgi:nicotinamide-nucleotide amidase